MNARRYCQQGRTTPGTPSFPRWIAERGARFVAVLLFAAGATSLPAQEFRAAWADVFHVGMGSQTEVNNMVSALVAGRYNAVIVQVVGYMDSNGSLSHGAHWQSNILPWSPRVTSSFDPLAYLCTQAHANGIEVHAWLGGSGGGHVSRLDRLAAD